MQFIKRIGHDTEKARLQKLLEHQCQLPDFHKNLLVQFINAGYFVNFRRKFHSLLICNEDNPRSKRFLKSSAAIYLEKQRHLQSHYHMVHPFSKLRVVWEVFMVFILCTLLLYIPVDVCFAKKENIIGRIPRILLDTVCMMDIVLSFVTGYQDSTTKRIEMNSKKVAHHYMKTWFVLDLVSSLNTDLIILAFHMRSAGVWLLKVPSILKIFRLITLMKYMERFREWKEYSLYKFKMIKMSLLFVISVLWGASGLYLTSAYLKEEWLEDTEGEPNQDEIWQGLRQCIIRVVMNFLLISHGEQNSHKLVILLIEIFLVSVGWCIKLSVTAQIVQIVMKYSSLNDKYYQMVQQFQEYMKSKHLPDSVQKRVLAYFEFRFQRNYYKENEILGSLSNQLKQEIILHTCGALLTGTEVFHDVPRAFLVRVSYMMKMEIFLPSDVVIISGSEADTMFFILTGMVAVYDQGGKEMCHLADGSYFGEMSLFVTGEHRKASVVSIDFCEMYTLSKEHFNEAIAPYPDLLDSLKRRAKARLREFLAHEEHRKRMRTYSDLNALSRAKDGSKTRMYHYV